MANTPGPVRTDPNPVQRRHRPAAPGNERAAADVHAANIVIFGETGVGKSSVINLIAGQELAYASNDARGCTFQHIKYPVRLDQTTSCAIWDTAGLDEATHGTVPAKIAEAHLRELMRGLMLSGGIHLIIYCIRGRRLTQDLKRNYDLFYATVCRRKVPIALVVTALEHEEGDMETWWINNEEMLLRNGMQFDAHACITTLDTESPIIRQRRDHSKELLHQIIVKFSSLPAWNIDLSLMSRIFPGAVRGLSFAGNLENTAIIRKVIVCDSSSELLPGTSARWTKSTAHIGDREYEFHRVDRDSLHAIGGLEDAGAGAGVLVFYTSALVDGCILQTDIDALKMFYDLAGGQLCPVILILRGCNNEQVARRCYTQVTSHYSYIRPNVVPLPSKDVVQADLDEAIERLCIEQVELKSHGFVMFISRLLSRIVRVLAM